MALLASGAQSMSILRTPRCSWWSVNNASPSSFSARQKIAFQETEAAARFGLVVAFRAAATGQGTVTETAGCVTEVDKDTFWPLVEGAGDKLVVLDMYTQWCGPCKLMFPKILDLSTKYTDVLFFKLDCNQHNKPLAKELGVRVVPTFKILKHKQIVAEVAGAKFDELVRSIEKARTQDSSP